MQSRTLSLSPDFIAHIKWCQNPENMPEVREDAQFDEALICSLTSLLPKIPVELNGLIYDLDSISSPDRQDGSKRILKIIKDPETKNPITNPEAEIKPVSGALRTLISRERKKIASPHQASAASTYSAPVEPRSPAPQPSPAQSSPALFSQARTATAAPVKTPEQRAPERQVVRDAPKPIVKNLSKQDQLNEAFCISDMQTVNAILHSALTVVPSSNLERVDITMALFKAWSADQFSDDKSLLRLLASITSPKVMGFLVYIFKQQAGPCQQFGIISSADFHQRLEFIYNNQQKHPNFDAAYNQMLKIFGESPSNTSGIRVVFG